MRDYAGFVSITAVQQPSAPPSRKKSKREIARIIDQIGTMLAAGMIDREIWQRLGITRTRYFVYRARLYQQSGDLFDKTTNDELIYHKDLLHERLTRLFRQAELDLTQTTNNNASSNLPLNTRDRAATYLAAQNIAINIFKLEHEGLRVLSHDGVNSNRYLRRASTEAQSGRQVRILPGYTEEGGRVSSLIRTQGIAGNQDKKPDESEIY